MAGDWSQFMLLCITLMHCAKSSRVEFLNVACSAIDPEFLTIEECAIKAVNRTYKYITVRIHLLKIPITKVKGSVAAFKRYNGYRPFLYNITVDACSFLKNRKKSPVADYFFGFFDKFSNLNHTCPYDHDIIIEKVDLSSLEHRMQTLLQVPSGTYSVRSSWWTNGTLRLKVDVYAKLN